MSPHRIPPVVLLLACALAAHAQDTQTTPAPPAATTPAPEDTPKASRPVMTPPVVTHTEEPVFSKEARKKKVAGHTMVSVTVDAQGMPQDIRVVKSAGEPYKDPKIRAAAETLDPKAIEAVQGYRFKPATRNGVPVAVKMYVDVNFQIF